jgi:hypothetical protein
MKENNIPAANSLDHYYIHTTERCKTVITRLFHFLLVADMVNIHAARARGHAARARGLLTQCKHGVLYFFDIRLDCV